MQVCSLELADTRLLDSHIDQSSGVDILSSYERRTTQSLSRNAQLVSLEIGLLNNDLDTILQSPNRRAELVGRGLHYGRALQYGTFGDQRLLHHVVLVGLQLRATYLIHNSQHLLVGRNGSLGLLGSGNDHHVILLLEELLCHSVERVQIKHRHDLLNKLILGLSRRNGRIGAESIQILPNQLTIAAVVSVVVTLLIRAQNLSTLALQLRHREAETLCLLNLSVEGLKCLFNLAVACNSDCLHNVLIVGQCAVSRTRCNERSVGLLRDVAQTVAEHRADHFDCQISYECLNRVVHLLRYGIVLDHHHNAGRGHLGIGCNANHRLVVTCDLDHLLGLGILHCGNVRHHLLDLLDHLVGVEITNNDYGLQVGTIPAVVEILNILIGKRFQTLDRTDDITLAILRVVHHHGAGLLVQTPVSVVARTQLLDDHTALVVDLLVFERDEVRPIVQDQQTGIDDTLTIQRHARHIVAGLLLSGESVEVSTELHTHLLQVVDQHLAGQVLRAIESHMLQEVSQTLLVILLLNSTHVVQNVELGLISGLGIATYVVGHTVVQLAGSHSCIGRNHLSRCRSYECYDRS